MNPLDRTTINFNFDVAVSVDAAQGVDLNFIQKRLQEQLEDRELGQLVSLSQSEGHITNVHVSAAYRGMTLGSHVRRPLTADEMAEATYAEMEADRLAEVEAGRRLALSSQPLNPAP